MIVACPNCRTQFEFDATRVSAANVKLKCSRCRAVFPAPASKKQAPASPAPPLPKKPEPPVLDSLELPFEETDWKSGEGAEESLVTPENDDTFTLGAELSSARPGPDVEETPLRTEEPPAAVHDLEPMFDQDEEDDFEVSDEGDDEPDPKRSETGMVWAILLFLGLVLLGYGGLTAAFFADPVWRDQTLARLPFVAGTGNDRLLHRKIALSDVVGTHQSIRDDKHVLVISGNAYNTAAEPLLNVQIVSTLFDPDGREVGRKSIHLGNVISTKVLAEMTRKEIEVFHNLNVSWRNIEPGQIYPFVIVFPDPPKGEIHFTTKVAGAFRQRG